MTTSCPTLTIPRYGHSYDGYILIGFLSGRLTPDGGIPPKVTASEYIVVCTLLKCRAYTERPYLPNISTEEGLRDVLALSHILIFSDLLETDAFAEDGIDDDDTEDDSDDTSSRGEPESSDLEVDPFPLQAHPESQAALERCRQFKEFFLCHYVVSVDEREIDAEKEIFDVGVSSLIFHMTCSLTVAGSTGPLCCWHCAGSEKGAPPGQGPDQTLLDQL